jgi:hypothetical protein
MLFAGQLLKFVALNFPRVSDRSKEHKRINRGTRPPRKTRKLLNARYQL